MKPWNEAAEEVFSQYCDQRRANLLAAGADPDEVFADWRCHIVEAALRSQAAEVTAEEVRRLLTRLDAEPAETPAPRSAPSGASVASGHNARPLSIFALVALALFGVALPVITLLVEGLSGLCASILFDPLPTLAHVALITLVPLANLLALLALRHPTWRPWKATLWLNGLAMGIALYYALQFAVITPFACIALLYLGLGLLPLSPLMALVCTLLLRRRLRRMAPAAVPVWRPLLTSLAALLLLAAPKIITLTGLHLAAADNAPTRARGLHLLRSCGSREELLRASYVQRAVEFDPLVWLARLLTAQPPPLEQIREIYYRVTGQPFNTVRPPDLRGRRGALFNADEWDFAQSGEQVAARLRGLTLEQSRLDGRVEAAAGLAYLEWTLVFKNKDPAQREARAQMLLPPGGVVSRLTLWVNGEEREAAFSGRGQVRAAYQSVVQRRRDPVLVTTCGPDRVLLQCFPVPPNGGTMKTRVGITVPLSLLANGEALLALPLFLETNFGLDAEVQPAVWLESDGALTAPGLTSERLADGKFALRGTVLPAALEQGTGCVLRPPAPALAAVCRLERGEPGRLVLQTLRPVSAPAPTRCPPAPP
ncbi:MAG: VIT domain-containing protein [Kiritimatiellaeota bacterium]|nr:VIT domain-containing protein [Kiritimatiellota bacterium]